MTDMTNPSTPNTSVTAQFGAGERGEPDLAKLSQMALQFRLGTRRLFEEGQTKGDMWFFELWHFLGDVQDALAAPVSHTSVKDGGGDAVAATPSKSKFDETGLSKHLREIIGQETTPPLWIYVTKEQIPILATIADRLDWLESLYAPFITDHPPQPAVHAPAQAPEQPTGSDAVADGAREKLAANWKKRSHEIITQRGQLTDEEAAEADVLDRCAEELLALRSDVAPVKAVGSEALREARIAELERVLGIARKRIEYLGLSTLAFNMRHFEANEKEFLPMIDAALTPDRKAQT